MQTSPNPGLGVKILGDTILALSAQRRDWDDESFMGAMTILVICIDQLFYEQKLMNELRAM
jgi:hypothetical protein